MDGYKTYLGIIITLAPTVAHMFGYTLTPAFMQQFPGIVDTLVTLAGGLFAFYGRLKATTPGWLAKQ